MAELKLRIIAEAFDKASKPFKALTQNTDKLRGELGKTAKELKGLQATQKRLTAFKSLKSQSADTAKQLKAAQEQAQNLARANKRAENPTRAMGRAALQAANKVRALKERQMAQVQALNQARSALGKAGINTRNLAREQATLATKIAAASRGLNRQERALKRAAQQQRKLADAGARYRKTLQAQSNLAVSGAAGLAGGTTALRGLAGAVRPGMSFDEAMSAVGAIGRIAKTSQAFKDLRNQALALGNTTAFSATQAAGGMEFLAMAGLNAREIMAAMPGMLNLAKAGRMELAESADIASNILSAFNLDASKMGGVADTLVATFTRSNVSLRQLGETMSYVAPAAFEAGASMQEASAMAGLLGNVGIQASSAGTVLRSMYTRMASPPRAAAKALAKIGVTTKDAAGNMRAMPEILAEIASKTEAMGNADRLGIFTAIAGKQAGSGMAALVRAQGAEAVTQFVGVLNDAENEAARVSALMGDNLSGDIVALGSAWEGMNIAMADTQTFGLRNLVQGITGMVRGVTAWARENPKLAGTLFTIAGVLATVWAVAGGLAIAVAGLLGPFAMAKFAMVTIGLKAGVLVGGIKAIGVAVGILGKALLLNPIGLIALAVVGAAYMVWKYWDQIKTAFTQAAAWISNLAGRFKAIGGQIVDGLISGFTGRIGKMWEAVKTLASGIKTRFADLLGIRSPSRVFAGYGGDITLGLVKGIEAGQGRARSAITRLTATMPNAARAGALAASVSAAGVASLSTVPAYAGASQVNAPVSQTIEIHVHAAPGMNEADLANRVAEEVDRIMREQEARSRARFGDY